MTESDRVLLRLLPIGIILVYVALVEGQQSHPSSSQSQLVPTIIQENYELVSTGNKYYLRLGFPDGGRRAEFVELLTDENGKKTLAVKGILTLVHNDTPLQVTVLYEADANGYRAKYEYAPIRSSVLSFASANLLKSAAG